MTGTGSWYTPGPLPFLVARCRQMTNFWLVRYKQKECMLLPDLFLFFFSFFYRKLLAIQSSFTAGWQISCHRPRDGSHMLNMVQLPTSRSPEWPGGTEMPPILVHLPTLRLAQINLNLAKQGWNSLCYSWCDLYSDHYNIQLAFVNLKNTWYY